MRHVWLVRLYWFLWFLTTILAGILSGYMVSHSIMLGRFFNWFIESDNLALLEQTYTVFRAGGNAHRVYDIPLGLHLLIGSMFATLALVVGKHRVLSVLTGLSTWWVGAIFLGLGVDEAEDSVLTSMAPTETVQYFLDINIPVHSSFAVIYLTGMALMLLIPLLEMRRTRSDA